MRTISRKPYCLKTVWDLQRLHARLAHPFSGKRENIVRSLRRRRGGNNPHPHHEFKRNSWVQKSLKLTKRQKEIIVGLLLGDGHLETQDNGRTYRLKVEHGPSQYEYVLWLFKELENLIRAEHPFEKKAKDGRVSFGFTTYSLGILRFCGQQFYADGKKQIPSLISKLLTPLSIAVWFMDDGSRKSDRHATYIIHTLGYDKKDLERMCEVLEKRFEIKSTLHRQKGKYWRMYILTSSATRFRSLIEPYIKKEIPSLMYKFGGKQLPKK